MHNFSLVQIYFDKQEFLVPVVLVHPNSYLLPSALPRVRIVRLKLRIISFRRMMLVSNFQMLHLNWRINLEKQHVSCRWNFILILTVKISILINVHGYGQEVGHEHRQTGARTCQKRMKIHTQETAFVTVFKVQYMIQFLSHNYKIFLLSLLQHWDDRMTWMSHF